MDEETQRLVKRYGLDRRAHEMHNRIMHEKLIEGFCERIKKEKESRFAKFVIKKAYQVPYNIHGSSDESWRWDRDKEQAEINYLQDMLKTWNLKQRNRERVVGLAAYRSVHSICLKKYTRDSNAQKLLELIYNPDIARDIIQEWEHWIDYYFDQYNDI